MTYATCVADYVMVDCRLRRFKSDIIADGLEFEENSYVGRASSARKPVQVRHAN